MPPSEGKNYVNNDGSFTMHNNNTKNKINKS